MMKLHLADVSKSFRTADGSSRFWAVRDVSLDIDEGEVVTLVGPSGCGKSTVLNCIGGLLDYDGTIEVDGRRVTAPGPDRAIVFQQASLLPWRTAAGNVAYGMELQRLLGDDEIERRVDETLELVELTAFADYYPGQLSGGMQQRVNLARALATGPEILLMDEPFGALDALTKERLQQQLMGIVSRSSQAVLFITHDINEAIYLGDRVVVMGTNPGGVREVIDVPYERPRAFDIEEEPEFQELRRRVRRLLDREIEAGELSVRG